MAEPPVKSPSERFLLVASEPLRLRDALDDLGQDVDLLEQIGPPDAPHTAVVSMTRAQADSLALRFKNLKIEPDQPLSLNTAERRCNVDLKGNRMAKNPESGTQNPPDNLPSKPNGGPPAASPNAGGGSSASGPRTTPQSSAGLSPQSNSGPSLQGSPGSQPQPASALPSATPAAGPIASSGNGNGARSESSAAGRPVSQRKGQYVITARRMPGLQALGIQPLSFSVIEQKLRDSPDIEIIDTVGPKNIIGALADGIGDTPNVLVARMPEQKAVMLQQQAAGHLIVERDQHLSLCDPSFQFPGMVGATLPVGGPSLETSVVVVGKDGAPVADAEVYLFGSLLPAHAVTDASGKASLSLAGETAQSIHSLYVKPRADYWSFHQLSPDISTSEPNLVALRPLSDWPGLPNFPQQQAYTWGQKAMRLDQLPQNFRGQGIRIAVIDSGAATTHDDLNRIQFGFDVINKKTNPGGWTTDTVAHGSHCAGVIAGADNGHGVRGFAPDAEIHACKLFPGGQISQLIDALEYCIEKQVDVVNLSLGGADPSEALEQQIQRARRVGIACIVAAGNSGGPVQYPASSPNVLAVAAIGKLNEFPNDSYHTQTVAGNVDEHGYFSARFSCFGPPVAVCGPGVAITSCVPANNYAVWDGTSMAAPHITGLAALMLAHHPDFQGAYKARSAERVERLFQMIRLSARPINLGDPTRTGLGLPDVLVAVGLQTRLQAFGPSPFGTLSATSATPGGSLGATIGGLTANLGGGFGGNFGGIASHIGGAVGNQLGGLGMMQAPVFDGGAQQWAAQPWAQFGQASTMIDPGYASLMLSLGIQPQLPTNFPSFPFGIQAGGFGRPVWQY